jgi:F0F1-type ATP synthase assembly protein I
LDARIRSKPIFKNALAMKSKIIFIILLLAIVSINAFAAVTNQDVGVPLDGGLLSILGAAGVAYFIARRKKKNADN